MKKIFRSGLFFLIAVLVLSTSCKKQRLVKDIAGTRWQAIEVENIDRHYKEQWYFDDDGTLYVSKIYPDSANPAPINLDTGSYESSFEKSVFGLMSVTKPRTTRNFSTPVLSISGFVIGDQYNPYHTSPPYNNEFFNTMRYNSTFEVLKINDEKLILVHYYDENEDQNIGSIFYKEFVSVD